MTTQNHSETLRQARELGAARGLASDLSATIRRLDQVDRHEQIRRQDAPLIAAMLLDLQAVEKALTTAKVQKDSRLSFWQSEHQVLSAEVDARIKRYLSNVPDADFLRLGPTAWARKIVKAAAAAKTAADQRRAARAAGTTPAPVRRTKAARGSGPGYCTMCGVKRERPTLQGMCSACIDKTYPRIARRK